MTKRPRQSKRRPPLRLREETPGRIASEFDREFVVDTFREPSAAERAQWENAKRKRGRPVRGQGAKVISVSIEKGLLKQADSLARAQGVSRATIIARGIRAVLTAVGENAA